MKSLKNKVFLFFLPFCITVSAQNTTNLSGEQREAYIQKAIQYRKQEKQNDAIKCLDTILSYNKADAQILLFKGDLLLELKDYPKAINVLKALLPLNYEKTISQINLSYALFMNHKPAVALGYAKQAWTENKNNTSAVINYFNAMLWNIKTTPAKYFLDSVSFKLTNAQQLVLKARLYTTSGNYNKGLMYYDSLVKLYPEKYYIQEFAEVLLGKKEVDSSSKIIANNKQLFTINELDNYYGKVASYNKQFAGIETNYFKDIGNNIRFENALWWQQIENKKYRFGIKAGSSNVTSINNEKTQANYFGVFVNERWNKALTGQTEINVQQIKLNDGKSFSGITGKQSINYQPHDRRMVGAFISTEILNFTADLFGKNIRATNLGYVTHLMIDGKNGFYSQGSWGTLNDDNKKLQFFGSLYHLFRTEPTLKGGLNFSALHFSNNATQLYFAPNQYLSTEVFVDYTTALPQLSKFYLQTQIAGGYQKIEEQKWTTSFRLMTELGVRLKKIDAALKYQTSNVAANNGNGYKFNWFTLRLMYKW
ncbi:MAG: tetratricopeptide repeat protein [Chitinophagaceae bacterium]